VQNYPVINPNKRVFTCTPAIFKSSARFFERDSGLLCKGLLSLGITSKAVVLGSSEDAKSSLEIRASFNALRSSEFWRNLNLDAVILYSWGLRRYLPVARAISSTSTPLLINIDSCGLVSRFCNPHLWRRDLLPYLFRFSNTTDGIRALLSQTLDSYFFKYSCRGRLDTYTLASAVTGVSPLATEWLRKEANYWHRPDLQKKIHYLPHPQMSIFRYRGEVKEDIIISVGRWDMEDFSQKNPGLLIDATQKFLAAHPQWRVYIIGKGSSRLLDILGKRDVQHRDKYKFIEFLPPKDLVHFYQRAKIGCWSSRSEGQLGAGAQALCCGCSVVAGSSALLSCFHHYVSRESGRLALDMNPDALAEALQLEAQAWDNGQRDPFRISRIWCDEFHDVKVASRALDFLGLQR
jgi:glycosyltransferase involved in cell wall biosynthesis